MFEIKKRDDAGRIGILKIRERAFTTPDLIFFKSERFPVGNGIESTHLLHESHRVVFLAHRTLPGLQDSLEQVR